MVPPSATPLVSTRTVKQAAGKDLIGCAGMVLLALLFGALLACSLCHLVVTRQLEKPAAKMGKNGRYKGMQEFEMPEVKSSSWGMP